MRRWLPLLLALIELVIRQQMRGGSGVTLLYVVGGALAHAGASFFAMCRDWGHSGGGCQPQAGISSRGSLG